MISPYKPLVIKCVACSFWANGWIHRLLQTHWKVIRYQPCGTAGCCWRDTYLETGPVTGLIRQWLSSVPRSVGWSCGVVGNWYDFKEKKIYPWWRPATGQTEMQFETQGGVKARKTAVHLIDQHPSLRRQKIQLMDNARAFGAVFWIRTSLQFAKVTGT